MADLNQFLNQDTNGDNIAHSNGYANIAGGAGAGGLSMEERRKRLNQPRIVGEYKHSRLGLQGSSQKAKTADQQRGRVYDVSSGVFVDDAAVSNRQKNDIKDSSQIDTKSIERRQRFNEPPGRGYDKFG
jgi:hypothetical protein